MLRVLIFDDNAKRVDALKLLLDATEGMDVVGSMPDCRDVLKCVEILKPDLVLMDIDMPHVNGIEGVGIIRTRYTELKILIQTVFEDDDKVFAAICAGANGYLLKQATPDKLLSAIKEVMEDGAPMSPVVAAKVLKFFHKTTHPAKQDFELTKREMEILLLLSKGYSYKMIAEECFISYATVNTHITKIYQKLHVQSAAGAVAFALKEGLI